MKKRLLVLILFLLIVLVGCVENKSVYDISGAIFQNKVSSATPGTGSLSISATEVPQGVNVYIATLIFEQSLLIRE